MEVCRGSAAEGWLRVRGGQAGEHWKDVERQPSAKQIVEFNETGTTGIDPTSGREGHGLWEYRGETTILESDQRGQ